LDPANVHADGQRVTADPSAAIVYAVAAAAVVSSWTMVCDVYPVDAHDVAESPSTRFPTKYVPLNWLVA
jgi:hypothetical protein